MWRERERERERNSKLAYSVKNTEISNLGWWSRNCRIVDATLSVCHMTFTGPLTLPKCRLLRSPQSISSMLLTIEIYRRVKRAKKMSIHP